MIKASPTQLRKAANIQEKIQSLQKELGQLLGSYDETAVTEAPRKKRKKGRMSAAGRAAIRAAQKARWARIKGTVPSAKPALKPKIKRSAAWRAAVSAAAKARWAEAKKAGKARL